MSLALLARRTQISRGKPYRYLALSVVEEAGLVKLARAPYCLRILIENVLRHVGRNDVTDADVARLAGWSSSKPSCRAMESTGY